MRTITDMLVADLQSLEFSLPVTHVYNPLEYARSGYNRYLTRFGKTKKKIVLLGMNPGPFGMAQTGVPFGDAEKVGKWMGITVKVHPPGHIHPKRPIDGFNCKRREVSGSRLWGWAEQRYGTPQEFFERFFVINYCPLVFMEESGRNRTPDKLPLVEKKTLFQICDHALRQTIDVYQPQWVVGVGAFAEKRALAALDEMDVSVGRVAHPSPANPKANRGWESLVESELVSMGIDLDGSNRC
jgi:single-strand selective monofunctional uracil DNA glycosylase